MPLPKEIPHFHERLYQALLKGGDKTAFVYRGQKYSYTQVRNDVFSCAASLCAFRGEPGLRLGIFARLTYNTSLTILGSILSNITNIPLNPEFPDNKNAFIISHSEMTHIFVDEPCAASAVYAVVYELSAEKISSLKFLVLPDARQSITDLLDELEKGHGTVINSSGYELTGNELTERADAMRSGLVDMSFAPLKEDGVPETSWYHPESFDTGSFMHFMFTSGSTGQSKCVAVTWDNYSIYFDQIMKRYQLRESDVFSSFSEVTFDVNLQDTACALVCGGTVVFPQRRDQILPHQYIEQNGITVVHGGPYLIAYLKKVRTLDRIKINCLRLTIFVGEALWTHHLKLFHAAFPNSRMLNTYGPTECTVIFSYYEVPFSLVESDDCPRSIVPLGRMFDSVQTYVADEHGNPVPDGTAGELIVGGAQVTSGYYNSPERNAASFFSKDGVSWYRTGDQVVAETETIIEDCLHGHAGESFTCYKYIGRNDDMLKVKGYRISYYEVEEQLGMLTDKAVKVMRFGRAEGDFEDSMLVAAIEGASQNELEDIERRMKDRLVFYMQPAYFVSIEAFPRNVNRKVDRGVLKNMVMEHAAYRLNQQWLP